MVKVLIACMIVAGSIACDREHRKKCEWYLMPDPSRKDDAKLGAAMVPVCARNLTVNKEDCRLQTSMEFAQDAWNKKFRYVDLETESVTLPRTIKKIRFCE